MKRNRCSCFVVACWILTLLISAPNRASAQASRVTADLQVLYTFDEGEGSVVHDRSTAGAPIDLTISDPKKTRWSRGFLLLQTESLLRSDGPATRVIDAVRKSQAVTIEAWVKPTNLSQGGPARLLSLSADTGSRNVTLGQQADAWEVRLRTTTTSTNGIPATTTSKEQVKSALTHVVYTRDTNGDATIFVDGNLKATQKVTGDFSNWDANYPLLIANEATRDRAWLGELHLVAIYSKALSNDEIQRNFMVGCNQLDQLAAKLPPSVDRKVDFVKDVQPILREHCFECHSTGNEEGSLNLAIKSRVLEGGEHGAVLLAGRSEASSLIHLVAGIEEDRAMPPADKDRLSSEQIGILRAWIDQGVEWPSGADVLDPRLEKARKHFAFQRLKPVERPRAKVGDVWCRSDIDVFISDKLVSENLSASPPLPSRSLARRLYFDLIGLPPTPKQADEFVAEAQKTPVNPAAELVDRLLDSPHYGERWGRHWLDLVRYADSDGQESDRDRPEAFHYRDFVIKAFNEDMPFDQFVRWQIAGDEYEPDNSDAIAATGFLTGGPNSQLDDKFLEEERLFNRYNELDDVVSTLGSSLLGLTVGCARCHDHKYDAFSAREYYRLLSVFHSGDRKTDTLPNGQKGLFFKDYDSSVRTTWLFRRSNFFDRELEVRIGFPAILSDGRDADEYWKAARETAASTNSTLQRRALADWITDVEHGGGALLARVIVNRAWQHHFGHGIVRTASDFGVRSEAPTHPELLEYLAADFVENGWKLKRLHRMILNSSTWQQSDAKWNTVTPVPSVPDAVRIDPENRLLSKMMPRRLEAEILRDAMLAASGTLNTQMYGPGFKPYIPAEANVARNLKDGGYPNDAPDNSDTRRRSVYMFHKRLVPYPLFQAFDRPDLLVSCARRQNTTVAPQALTLLNDRFVRACATDFARRLITMCDDNDREIVEQSFQIAFTRSPTESEASASLEFIKSQSLSRKSRDNEEFRLEAMTDYCQSLFGLNEFVYVD